MPSRKFFIPGTPAPQGSKRYVGRGRMVESSKKLEEWREVIAQVAGLRLPPIADCPVIVSATFILHRPQRLGVTGDEPMIYKPDLDKLTRALGDGLVQSRRLDDDSRIVAWRVAKRYAAWHEPLGCEVEVRW